MSGIENYLDEPTTTVDDIVELATALVKLSRLYEKGKLDITNYEDDLTTSDLRTIHSILSTKDEYHPKLQKMMGEIIEQTTEN